MMCTSPFKVYNMAHIQSSGPCLQYNLTHILLTAPWTYYYNITHILSTVVSVAGSVEYVHTNNLLLCSLKESVIKFSDGQK